MKSDFMKFITVALFISIFGLSSCAERSDNRTAATSKTTVTIDDSAFNPSRLRVTEGTVVTFVNGKNQAHSVAFPEEQMEGIDIESQDGSTSYTFNQPGLYEYYSTGEPPVKRGVIEVLSNGDENETSRTSTES